MGEIITLLSITGTSYGTRAVATLARVDKVTAHHLRSIQDGNDGT